jgi:hypothetical protein
MYQRILREILQFNPVEFVKNPLVELEELRSTWLFINVCQQIWRNPSSSLNNLSATPPICIGGLEKKSVSIDWRSQKEPLISQNIIKILSKCQKKY